MKLSVELCTHRSVNRLFCLGAVLSPEQTRMSAAWTAPVTKIVKNQEFDSVHRKLREDKILDTRVSRGIYVGPPEGPKISPWAQNPRIVDPVSSAPKNLFLGGPHGFHDDGKRASFDV